MAHSSRLSIHQRLDRIERMLGEMYLVLRYIARKDNIIMAAIDDLETEVARNTSVSGSVLTLVKGLADQLAAAIASGDPARIQAVLDTMRANDDSLAAAVTANTPAPVP